MPQEKKQVETSASARLVKELTRDKKKTGTLAILIIVGLVFGVRMMKKDTPASAGAASLGEMEEFSASTGSASVFTTPRQPNSAREIDIPLVHSELTRDLFSFDATNFEVIEKPLTTTDDPEVDTVSTEPPVQPDVQVVVQQEAESLDLQSTMASDHPVAIINGQVLTVGEEVEGFVVVSISTGSCVVAKQGVSVSLWMGQDKP
jgi:hypothetical protein